jgi:hypothetical protein
MRLTVSPSLTHSEGFVFTFGRHQRALCIGAGNHAPKDDPRAPAVIPSDKINGRNNRCWEVWEGGGALYMNLFIYPERLAANTKRWNIAARYRIFRKVNITTRTAHKLHSSFLSLALYGLVFSPSGAGSFSPIWAEAEDRVENYDNCAFVTQTLRVNIIRNVEEWLHFYAPRL